ncbi:interleukin 12 receptor, beta 2a, like [Osmerus mordax]|uniref:interleukin 12 receptor, beta 2a, like n=1 Tax=Osmerus mordax TaxID=8014 RepID=UPI00350FEE8F
MAGSLWSFIHFTGYSLPFVMARAWLISHLLMLRITPSNGLVHTGPLPHTPSTPRCSIPYSINEDLTIQCSWDPGPDQDPGLLTSYSIHWAADLDTKTYSVSERSSGVIPRDDYPSHRTLWVWVVAKNQYGSAQSDNATFRTDLIRVPPAPIITEFTSDYLEITWGSGCSLLKLSEGDCDVRYRSEGQKKWSEVVNNLQTRFELLRPLPFTKYEFQVRCGCKDTILSEWSSVQRVGPSGQMDVWCDCESLSDLSKCALMWKLPPPPVVHGLRYVVTVSYTNGTVEIVNVSTTVDGGRSGCKGKQCHLRSSLLGVSGVHVSAQTSHGATEPTSLALPTLGVQGQEPHIICNMDEVSLLVSWNLSSQFTNKLLGLVVQYKQAGLPPSQGIGWRKVHNNSQTSIPLPGSFENYTSYIVSLFGVLGNSSVFLSSTTAYAREGAPPQVPFIKIHDITDSQVTLSWGHIPLSQTRGVILQYLLEVGNQTVGNVSAEKNSYVISALSPGRSYKVGIRAVTKAGSGQAKIIHITTKDKQGYDITMYILIIPVIILLLMGFACKVLVGCDKVPDPKNSQLFQQMTKSQVSCSFNGAPSEPCPKISQLEVVQIEPQDIKAFPGKTNNLMETGNEEECIGTGTEEEKNNADMERGWIQIKGKGTFYEEAYSTMIDTDEEKIGGDMASLSEEETFFQDYEKHFMPTAVDV